MLQKERYTAVKLTTVITMLLFTTILLCSCSIFSSNKNSEDEAFETFTRQMFTDEITSNTINLHYTLADPSSYGIEEYEVTLGSVSSEAYKQSFEALEEYNDTLEGFAYDDLSSDNQLTYDILSLYFQTELSAKDLYLFHSDLSSTIGTQAQLPVLLAEYTFESENDIMDYLKLLNCLPDYYRSIIDFEEEKANAGLFMSDTTADGIISQCQSFIDNPADNYLIEIFNDKVDALNSLSEEAKSSYKQENQKALYTSVIPAYQIIINGLEALKGNGTNEGGLCNYDNGILYYEYLVKSSTGLYESIPEIQQRLNQQLVTDYQQMQAIIETNPDVLTSFATADLAEQAPEEILDSLLSKIESDFPEAPDVNYEIKYVHESLEEHISPAFYLTPPIDQLTENVIYLNGASNYDNLSLFTTLAHEGYPGHLYQTVYTASTNPDPVRNLLSFNGYTEGWATYVEMYSYSLADMDPDILSLLQLNQSITLCIYSNIDIGVHYYGWNREDTGAYLGEFGFSDENTANAIYDAIVEEPANYLKYYLGYLKMLDLRDTAMEALGDSFVLKDFHDFILTTGPAQFPILEKYLETYITVH